MEPVCTPQCVGELLQMTREEADLQELQAQNSILTHSLNKSRELIIFTDEAHHIRVCLIFLVKIFVHYKIIPSLYYWPELVLQFSY